MTKTDDKKNFENPGGLCTPQDSRVRVVGGVEKKRIHK